MTTIVKKGTNASLFRLKSGKKVLLEPDLLTVLSDEVYEELMNEYGSFISKRIISDKNPRGCFIVSNKKESAKSQKEEVGDEIKDNSAPLELDLAPKKRGRKGKK